MAIRNSKNCNRGSIFKKFSASLTVLLFLASTNLTTAALANNQGGRGAAFEQFQLNNPGLDNKELKQMFKQELRDIKQGNNVQDVLNNIQSTQSIIHNNNFQQHLDKNDFASKAEFQAAKQALQFQNRNLNDTINKTVQQVDTGKFVNVKGGLSLDLGSAVESITLGDRLFQSQSSVTINVGGQDKTVSSGSKVTAAEYIAAKQALAGANQTVTLDAEGRATGGVVDLSAMTNGNQTLKVKDLVVPVSVTAAGDFGKGGDVRISGDLSNSGAINAFTSDNKQVTALIKADNITNSVGGSITSSVSDLILQADKSLNNYGDISASGNLTLSAGKSLTNSGNVAAAGNLNVLSPKVANTGTLASIDANVNLDTPVAAEMSVNNNGGTISALNGAIDVRSADYAASFNSTVYGGDLLSKELNVNTGGGTANINVNDLTGVVNTSGSAAHVSANTDTLVLGEQCLLGDPTYFNDGNIEITGDITVGQDLAIIASGNIFAQTVNVPGNALNISAHEPSDDNVNQDGCNITMIAGANITSSNGSSTGTLSGSPAGATSVTFDGPSTFGGNIDFSQITNNSFIDARPGNFNGKGGNITLVAYQDNGNSGQVLLNSNWEINASGGGSGPSNGKITVIAGATSGLDAIIVGKVFNNSASGTAADINLINAQPVSSNGLPITFNNVGAISSGNLLIPSDVISEGFVTTGKLSSRGSVFVTSGRQALLGDIETGPGQLTQITAGDVTIGRIDSLSLPGLNRAVITSQGFITLSDQIRQDGGIILVAGRSVQLATDSASLVSTPAGNAPGITVVAGADFTVNGTNITINGQSTNGGSIEFYNGSGQRLQNLSASSNSGGGNGGEVNLITYGGRITLPGDYGSAPLAFSVHADSNGGSAINGTINIVAGTNASDAIRMGGAQADGSITNTGDINIVGGTPNSGVAISTLVADFGKTASSFVPASANFGSGVQVTRQLASNGGNIKIAAGVNGVIFDNIARFGHFEVETTGDIYATEFGVSAITGAGDQANTLLWTAGGNISFSGEIELHSTGGTAPPDHGLGSIVMVAAGTIQSVETSGFGGASINASSGLNGGNIAIVAGADFTKNPDKSITISGTSGFGGSILFDTGTTRVGGHTADAIVVLDSHSNPGNRPIDLDGGDITLIAFSDILLDTGTSPFFSAAAASSTTPPVKGTNGNVLVVGAGAITLPKIDLAEGQGGGATVRAAVVSSGTITSIGKAALGSFASGALLNTNFNFALNNYGGSNYNFVTLGDITLGTITARAQGGIAAGSINLQGANITVGNINVDSDVLNVAAGSVFIQGNNVLVGTISARHLVTNGDAGSVTLVSNSGTTFEIGSGSSGANRVGMVDLGVGVALGGNAGSLEIRNTAGGVKLTSVPVLNVNAGDGAHLTLFAQGTLDIQVLTTGFSANGNGAGDHDGGSISLEYLTLLSNAGNSINLTANSTGNGIAGNISVKNNGGNIIVGTNPGEFSQLQATDLTASSGSVSLTASGTMTLNGGTSISARDLSFVAAASLTINTSVGGTGLLSLAGNSVSTGGGSTVTLGSFSQSQIDINTPFFQSNDATNLFASDTIHIQSPSTSLQLDGAAGFNISGANGNFLSSAPNASMSLSGNINFSGPAYLTAGGIGQSITNNGTVTANTQSFAIASNIVNPGNFVNALGPWVFTNPGVWSNSGGSVKLSGLLNFAGANFAIISSGDIDLTGATIDLTGATNGGNLTMLAGYNFTGGIGSQQFAAGPFTGFTPSAGGSIIGGADIITNGNSGNGGNVVAAANNGTITLGDITTTGSTGFNGGTVRLIATNGIDVSSGTINTTGDVRGDVSLIVGNAILTGVSINGGTLTGSIGNPFTGTAGNMQIGSLIADDLSLRGAFTAGNSITSTGVIQTLGNVFMNAGDGTVTFGNAEFLNVGISANGAANSTTVNITNNAIAMGLSAIGNQNLTVTSNGAINMNGVTAASVNLTGTAGIGFAAVTSTASSVSGAATLTSLGGGDIRGSLDAGTSLTINSSGSVGVDGSNRFVTNAPQISVAATADVYLDSTNAGGVQFGDSIGGSTSVFDVTADGPVTTSGTIIANILRIATTNDDIGTALNPLSIRGPIHLAVATGTGDTYANALVGGDTIDLLASSGDDITLNTATGAITVSANSTFNGDIDFTAAFQTFNAALQSNNGDINIQSPSGAIALTLLGSNGFLTATNGVINVVSTNNNFDIQLQGDLTFNTTANLIANKPGQGIVIGANTITAVVDSFLITGDLTNNGTLVTLGSTWFIVNPGTLANSSGNVNLTTNQTFAGGNFAILASGNINLNNIDIDLSSGTDGGALTLIAGYDFSETTVGQQFVNGVIVDNFTPSISGGSITGNANINTGSSGSGQGGNVLAVARGTISLGSTNTTGSGLGTGGNVKVIASGNITTGDITAVGNNGAGSIELTTGTPSIPTGSGFQIQNGRIITGAVTAPALTNGTITVNGFISGVDQPVALTTGSGGSITYAGSGIEGQNLTFKTGALAFTQLNTINALTIGNSDGGTINLTANSVTTSGGPLHLDVSGVNTGTGGTINVTMNTASTLNLNDTSGQFFFDIGTPSSLLGNGGSLNFTNTGAGSIVLGAGAVTGIAKVNSSSVKIQAAGDITVGASSAFNLIGEDGKGAVIELKAGTDGTGNLILNDVTFFEQANATGSDHDGGTLSLTGSAISTFQTSALNPLILTANGTGTGSGGVVVFDTREVVSTLFGAPAKAGKGVVRFMEAYATGGGDGGTIDIRTGGNLTVNNVALLNAGTDGSAGGNLEGAHYKLVAGQTTTGALLIAGSLAANGVNLGDAGTIELVANSSAFTINPTKAPKGGGILGTLTANGPNGKITVKNLGGGILVSRPGSLNAPNVDLRAGGAGTITAGSGAVITATNFLELHSVTGAIGSSKAPLLVSTPDLLVSSTAGLAGVSNVIGSAWTLEDSLGAKGFTLKTAQNVTLNDITTTAGSILVSQTTGVLQVAANATLSATNGAVTLQNLNASGQIKIGDDAQVKTLGIGQTVLVTLGPAIPKSGINPFPGAGPFPAGVTALRTGSTKNFVFFGLPGVVVGENAGAPVDNAVVESKNANVIFNGTSAGSISLGERSYILADPPDRIAEQRIGAAVGVPTTIAAAIPASFDMKSVSLFGFAGENSTNTADLSVPNLNAAPQLQVANSATLITATNTGSLAAQAGLAINGGAISSGSIGLPGVVGKSTFAAAAAAADEDNSYAVGYCPATGSVDGAICSDSEIVDSQFVERANIQTIQHSDRVVIKKGNVLFVPFKNTTVDTPNGIVHIDAKSVALVSSTDAGLAVYDLEDQHKGSVSVESNGHSVVLSPGRHVMITPHHGAEFAQINAVETIAHRNVQSVVKNGHRAHTSEFSVLSAIDTVKPLTTMVLSKNAHARQIADHMLKTTAIILQIGGAAGQYQHYFKPRMTAMQK